MLEGLHTLRYFTDEFNKKLFDSAILNTLTLYYYSTEHHRLIPLNSTQIQHIQASFPDKVTIGFEYPFPIIPPSIAAGFLASNKAQILCIDVIWVEKAKAEEIMKLVFRKKNSEKVSRELSPRAENTLLHIIAALLEYIDGKAGTPPHPAYTNDSALITLLSEKYKGYSGMSERTLYEKFPMARRRLVEDI